GGNGDDRDQRGAQVAQEQEYHGNDQQHGLADGAVDGIDGGADENRGVVGNLGTHAFRQAFQDSWQGLAHPGRDIERIGHRLLHHADGNGGLAVEADADALVERTDLDARDIAHADRIAVHLDDDDGAGLFGGAQVGLRQHRDFHESDL